MAKAERRGKKMKKKRRDRVGEKRQAREEHGNFGGARLEARCEEWVPLESEPRIHSPAVEGATGSVRIAFTVQKNRNLTKKIV